MRLNVYSLNVFLSLFCDADLFLSLSCGADLQLDGRFCCVPKCLICNVANRLNSYILCCSTTLTAIVEEHSREKLLQLSAGMHRVLFQTIRLHFGL